jgi:electron transport protein HydN
VETAEVARDGTVKKVANKCDLCKGVADKPSCIRVCPTEALALVTEDSFTDTLDQKRRKALSGNESVKQYAKR